MRIATFSLLLLLTGCCRAFWLWDYFLGATPYDADEVVEGTESDDASPNFATANDSHSSSSDFPIKTVVILVLENRSFDNICGFFDYKPSINGVKKQPHCNSLRKNNTHSETFCTNNNATLVFPDNPSHEFDQITKQIYGTSQPALGSPPAMSGFIEERNGRIPGLTSTDLDRLFQCYDPSKLPVLYTLAKEFVLFDRWFASVPSCTLPNRAFVHAHTSNGVTRNFGLTPVTGWPNKSIWDILDQHRISWANYFQEVPTLTLFKSLRTFSHWSNFKYYWNHFEQDAASGNLPSVSFVDPIYGYLPFFRGKNNDGHGPTDFHRTEVMLKQMYDTLRKSPQWDNMLWVITFDEHGGFPDHVSPPEGVPSPDNAKGSNGFAFDRLGVRVPTILVSPWLKRGLVVHDEGFSPFSNSEYEHSSIGATLFKLLNIKDGTLSRRTEWARTFEPLLTELKEARKDCPLEMPAPFKEERKVDEEEEEDEIDFEDYSRWTRAELLDDVPRRVRRRSPRGGEKELEEDEEVEGNMIMNIFKGFLGDMNATQQLEIFGK